MSVGVWASLGLCILVAASPLARAAEPVTPPALEDFVKLDTFGLIEFSPDASRFAAAVERQGQMIIAVVDAETRRARTFAHESGLDAVAFRWLSNDLIEVRSVKLGVRQFDLNWSDVQRSYISVDDKSHPDRWSLTDGQVRRRVPGSDTDVVIRRVNSVGTFRLEVVDSASGVVRRRLTGDPPGTRVRDWVLDNSLAPRAATGYDIDTRKVDIWWRDTADAPWAKLFSYDPRIERGYFPVAVDDNGNLLVLSNLETGRYALHRFDRSAGRPGELLAGHAGFDINPQDLIYGENSMAPVGVAIDTERPQTFWFDDARAEMQRAIDASLPAGRVNALRFLQSGKVLVHSYSDIEPGTYYFFDPQAKTLTEWIRARPWIQPQRMSRTEIVRYRARDGQELFGYFTSPARAVPGPAPLLVWVHGGPGDRDRWGFDADVQFFASRGFAVFQPTYRGSTGLGEHFERAGFKQWGRLMQDDITDGVRALIAAGRADERRVCIGGVSYGGYAALMGVIREPELFRCAVDEAGPTDLLEWITSPVTDFNRRTMTFRDGEMRDSLKEQIGDPDDPQERSLLEAASPRRQAARIKASVLLLYGSSDVRIPFAQGTSMRDALRSAGGSVEWVLYSGEGHGLWDRRNRADRLRRLETFLVKHLSPQP